jgi:hypothetical protein
MTNEPTLAEVQKWAEDLKKNVLQCRLYGCGKIPSTAHWVQLEGRRKPVLETELVCRNRCGCWWTQLVDPETGNELGRLKKHYPKKGFLAPGIGRIFGDKKAVLRLEHIKREYTLDAHQAS